MSTSTLELTIFVVLSLAVVAAAALTLLMLVCNIIAELADVTARHSQMRREHYHAQRLQMALTGLIAVTVSLFITAATAWIL